VALAAAGVSLWRATRLIGLPDIGDPFDVSAVRGMRVPDDQNAYTWLRQAERQLSPFPRLPHAALRSIATVVWADADPMLREWVEANHASLELYQQAAERPDWQSRPAAMTDDTPGPWVNVGELASLVLLEGARRTESGDTRGAWECYRAVLRVATLARRRGDASDRMLAGHNDAALHSRIDAWAADSRTTIAQLRTALADAVASEPKPEWDAFSLKLQYLELMSELERHASPVDRGDDSNVVYRIGELQIALDMARTLYPVRRYLAREPERTRRVLRLLAANWVAHAEHPDPEHRKPAVLASIRNLGQTIRVPVYAAGPEAPASARTFSPEKLAAWLVSTYDLGFHLWRFNLPPMRPQELRSHRALVVQLATELYRRERGELLPSEESLVGPYLKNLPDDGSAELDDGTIPVVTDAPARNLLLPN
jgi:hypothetical protein